MCSTVIIVVYFKPDDDDDISLFLFYYFNFCVAITQIILVKMKNKPSWAISGNLGKKT